MQANHYFWCNQNQLTMKYFYTTLLVLFSLSIVAQSPGDTIVVETFNYTQTHGWPWSGMIRDTMIDFPDDSEISYEKVIMLYNMRCKDGLVSDAQDRNKGCGEWDYSCNTYIHDSSRVDSVLSFTSSHTITNFSGGEYNFIETPTYNYYQYLQQDVQIDQTNSEDLSIVGNGTTALTEVIKTDQYSGKSQYLLKQDELEAAGVTAGDINGILLDATTGADAGYFMVKIKSTQKTELAASNPDFDDFTEVYFHDYSFSVGSNRIQFHTPFNWDGTSNLIFEFSFTNNIASNALEITGDITPSNMGLYSNNGTHLENIGGYIQVPTEPFSSISEEITISFWSYGNESVQPINNSIVHGKDGSGNRTLNIHLPWSNSNVYWDCGNDGGTYDRINALATEDQYKGKWNHWAATKNAVTGQMNLYYNGELWLSGADKSLLIDIQDFVIGNNGNGVSTYFGKIDEVRIWDTELSESMISAWMYKSIDNTHPDYNNLVAYYKIDEGDGNTTMDASTFGETGEINGFMYWLYERGDDLNHGFSETTNRPNITIAQGDYELTITDDIVTDSVANYPNIVTEYEIIPKWGTMQNDSINQVSLNEYWEAVYEVVYDYEGEAIDSTLVTATGTIVPEQLEYFKRYPMKFEIMSFVTPYGIFLDLGMDGKTWAFDVTDYLPILKGKKRMTIERGGEWQEDMDIRFLFIVGTPPRDVLDVQQIWRADSKGYVAILEDRAFEPRDIPMHADGQFFKLRTTITGHGQQGEFTGRNHFININGNEEFLWKVWTECASNPIYPQGGTWIYDRAGWCPGQASDLEENDITNLVTAGEIENIDYGLQSASGTSNYIVNNQLVTYGGANFELDAAVSEVLRPNSMDAKNDRFNPACSYPEIVIQNTGTTTLTSLDIEYKELGGQTLTYNWSGALEFLEKETVVLPIDDLSFWLPTSNIFVVEVKNPNGQQDEYAYNNTYKASFEGVDIFPDGESIIIECITNNYAYQNSYFLHDGQGNLIQEWGDLEANTTYADPMTLETGCYKLRIDDLGGDGLEFWNKPNQGEGTFKIKTFSGEVLYEFDPDFGNFAEYEFGIGEITTVDDIAKETIASVFPNPANNLLNIYIEDVDSENINISLLNAVGAVIYEKVYTASGESFNTELQLDEYPTGIYFINIKSGDYSSVQKVVKK